MSILQETLQQRKLTFRCNYVKSLTQLIIVLQHIAKEHPFHCLTCERFYQTSTSLVEHYRGSPNHPNCPTCGQGFLDKMACFEVLTFPIFNATNHCLQHQLTHSRYDCPRCERKFLSGVESHLVCKPNRHWHLAISLPRSINRTSTQKRCAHFVAEKRFMLIRSINTISSRRIIPPVKHATWGLRMMPSIVK